MYEVSTSIAAVNSREEALSTSIKKVKYELTFIELGQDFTSTYIKNN